MPRAKPAPAVATSPLAKALATQTTEGLVERVEAQIADGREQVDSIQRTLEAQLQKNLEKLVDLRDSTALSADEVRAANVTIKAIQTMLAHTHVLLPKGPGSSTPRDRPLNVLVQILADPGKR